MAVIEASHVVHPLRNGEDLDVLVAQISRLAGVTSAPVAATRDLTRELGAELLRRDSGAAYVLARQLPGAGLELIGVDQPSPAETQSLVHDELLNAPLGPDATALTVLAPTRPEVYSPPNGGVIITVRVGGDHRTPGSLTVGAVSVALDDSGNGDGWAALTAATGMTLVVFDGLGHGAQAANAAQAALAALGDRSDVNVEDFFQQTNRATRRTRGGAVSWARINTVTDEVEFAGAGNVEGQIVHRGAARGLAPRPGTMGMSQTAPRPRVVRLPWGPGATLVLHTDGVKRPFDLPPLCGPAGPRDPSTLAAVISRDHARENDDTTVVVIKDTRPR